MPAVTVYKSKAGNTFETEFEEHRDDLRELLARLVENEPIARTLTEKLSNGAFDEFYAIVSAMRKTAAPRSAASDRMPMQSHLIGWDCGAK